MNNKIFGVLHQTGEDSFFSMLTQEPLTQQSALSLMQTQPYARLCFYSSAQKTIKALNEGVIKVRERHAAERERQQVLIEELDRQDAEQQKSQHDLDKSHTTSHIPAMDKSEYEVILSRALKDMVKRLYGGSPGLGISVFVGFENYETEITVEDKNANSQD